MANHLTRLRVEYVPLGHHELALRDVHGADLQPHRHTLHLPVVELPARCLVPVVQPHTDASLLELSGVGRCGCVQGLPVFRGSGRLDADRHDDHLQAGHLRRKHQSLVIAVHHDHDPNCSLRYAPRVLVGMLAQFPCGVVGVLEGDVEHLREVLAQVVRGGSLDGPPCHRDESLHCGGVVSARESLRLGLSAAHHRECQELLINASVELQDLEDLLVGRRPFSVGRVPLLPKELACA
mmetsp:Transcript_4563/g.9404  ORF Transcript_4563/g.9404 Transcript_4563/m.9404 type:complete len:237 (+) Transcript_4563:451-1161(+)